MTTFAWRKLNRAPRGCRLPLPPPCSTACPSHRRRRPLPVGRYAPLDSNNNNNARRSSPARRTTTTGATRACPGPQRGRWRLRQPQLQGSGCQRTLAHRLQPLDRLYPDVTKSRGYRAIGAETTSGHDGSCALLQLAASVGRACLCVTSYPPWAHAAARPAIAWTGVETVDWVLGLAVPRQLVRHHDAELSCHHGLGRRLWRLQPYHA
jgi:hypothetical protein